MTVKQLAYLEPTLVEVVACMVGDLLNEALQETIHTVGVPEPEVVTEFGAYFTDNPFPGLFEAMARRELRADPSLLD